MTVIWNCALQKHDIKYFPIVQVSSGAVCSTRLYISVYEGKRVIANSNMAVSARFSSLKLRNLSEER